mmetsp:Transcript_39776/g.81447  ORF Transcript_39776/g.81447 Transcript_39776/m.81447 type:complete len:132 (+) Transcript_39776:198-593(+)
MMVVRPPSPTSLSIAPCTKASLSASNALVASSSSSTRGALSNARAIAMRCFCPPDSRTPLSPTRVCMPWGKFSMNSIAFALRATSSTFWSRASFPPTATCCSCSSTPYRMLLRMLVANKIGSCMTEATCRM